MRLRWVVPPCTDEAPEGTGVGCMWVSDEMTDKWRSGSTQMEMCMKVKIKDGAKEREE